MKKQVFVPLILLSTPWNIWLIFLARDCCHYFFVIRYEISCFYSNDLPVSGLKTELIGNSSGFFCVSWNISWAVRLGAVRRSVNAEPVTSDWVIKRVG